MEKTTTAPPTNHRLVDNAKSVDFLQNIQIGTGPGHVFFLFVCERIFSLFSACDSLTKHPQISTTWLEQATQQVLEREQDWAKEEVEVRATEQMHLAFASVLPLSLVEQPSERCQNRGIDH